MGAPPKHRRPRPGSNARPRRAFPLGLRLAAPGLVALGLAALAACGPRPPEGDAAEALADRRVVDLSHAFGPETVYWPTAPHGFEYDTLAAGVTEAGWWYAAGAFRAPEHGGTHLDAPVHFAREGWDVASVPAERLIGPAVVLDVTEAAAAAEEAGEEYTLSAEEVRAFEARHGRIPEDALVLLRTGWSERWPDARAYLGGGAPGDASDLRFPSYGPDAARLLVEERRVAALGADVASIDPGSSVDFPVHRIAAAANVVGLENLTRLEALPATGAVAVALPMKIRGGTGAPLRVVALVRAAAGSR